MINIHDRLWAIKRYGGNAEDSDYPLAYMTYYKTVKDSEEPDKACTKCMETGRSWARPYPSYGCKKSTKEFKEFEKGDYELTFDNSPDKGFKIVGSVSRWSTSNKLIRVEDPRGFVVEIPTGNLTTLLKHTTVEKGVIQESCVWGREGNNHILLPTNSVEYKQARAQTDLTRDRVSFVKLDVGDKVKFSVDDSEEFIYLGRAKAVWEWKIKQAVVKNDNRLYYRYDAPLWKKTSSDEILEEGSKTDPKWCFVFKPTEDRKYRSDIEYKTSGKALVISKGNSVTKPRKVGVWLPERASIAEIKSIDIYTYCNETVRSVDGRYSEIVTKKLIWKE